MARRRREKYAAALKAGWEKAGFKVTLDELTDTYYDVIQNPTNATKYDVTWAGWGADWPNASTVIPPLFDSRVNLSSRLQRLRTTATTSNPAVNTTIDAAYGETDLTKQAADVGRPGRAARQGRRLHPARPTTKFFRDLRLGRQGLDRQPGVSD